MLEVKLRRKWEKRLAKFGLASTQFDNKGIITQPVAAGESSGIQNHQFDRALEFHDWRNSAAARIDDDLLNSFHEVPVRVYSRDIPAWAHSDQAIRTLLFYFYPALRTNPKHRKWAAQTCAIIYRYFRLCEPAASIAEDFHVQQATIEDRIARVRARAVAFGF